MRSPLWARILFPIMFAFFAYMVFRMVAESTLAKLAWIAAYLAYAATIYWASWRLRRLRYRHRRYRPWAMFALFGALVANDYDGFARALLSEREAAGLPPFAFQALLRAEARKLDAALGFLTLASNALPHPGIEIYDPVPMTLTRLMNVERAQLLAESRSRPALQAFLAAWHAWLLAHTPPGVRWHIEVDPLEI